MVGTKEQSMCVSEIFKHDQSANKHHQASHNEFA